MSSNGIDGVSFWLAHGGIPVVLAGAVLGLAALVGLYRSWAWRRWSTVLDAYAVREIARQQHRKARQKQE